MSAVTHEPSDVNPQPTRPVALWTIDDLAAALQVSVKTVRRQMLAETLPKPLRIGRQLRWHPEEVAEHLRRRSAEAQGL